ncbi:class III signal peptide-containing protein [Methanobacterium sp. ACI-7]|uniref:class III signal peptide-containing protein n=1 Tax=unclassified Methanobacterium TaxID=2627676 RepID=UPI0039C2CCD0
MQILKDENGQGAAELILLFGGIIVIAIIAAIYYKNYLSGLGDEITQNDTTDVNNKLKNLTNKIKQL